MDTKLKNPCKKTHIILIIGIFLYNLLFIPPHSPLRPVVNFHDEKDPQFMKPSDIEVPHS